MLDSIFSRNSARNSFLEYGRTIRENMIRKKKKKEKKSRKATIVHNTDTQLERSQESGYTGHYVLGVSTMNDVCEKRAGC